MTSDRSHSSEPGVASQSEAEREDLLWQQVAEAVDALACAWESHLTVGASEPQWQSFLPDGDPALRNLAMQELVKVDLEYRWQNDCSPQKLEQYAQECPELEACDPFPLGLIHEELQVRMQAGQQVTENEIRDRFPKQATTLCELVGGMAVSGTPTCTYFADTKNTSAQPTDIASGSANKIPLEAGDKIDDFQLLTELGSGAFAQVFLARQISMERLVALKISSQRGSEPQTLAQLDHPTIVRVFDQRECGDPPTRLLYMEVVPGGTLQQVVSIVRKTAPRSRKGSLLLAIVDEKLAATGAVRPESSAGRNWLAEASWPMTVCRIGSQLAEGLAYAHSKGVLHRDIKPANVLLTSEGAPKLADFNVSYNGGRADEDPADTFGGSLAYMSPEQLQACHPVLGGSPQLVREASDVYSLGLLLWELLCGFRPFDDDPTEGNSLAKVQRMIDRRHYADFNKMLEQLPADCPESLQQVLTRCLQPRKDERYQSAAEVARDLRLCLHPRTWQMMRPAENPFSKLILQWPLLAIIVAGLTPNALAGAFNFSYNYLRIVEGFPHLRERFIHVQYWINGIAFPLGIGVGMWAALRVLRLVSEGGTDRGQEATRRVLFFGLFVSLLTLAMWTVSGIIFPIAIDLGLPIEGAMGFYAHFILSLALCGFAAMAYPYFLLTTLAVRWFFPALVRNGMLHGPRGKDLERLRQWNRVHLALSALVPMLGVLLVTASGIQQQWALLVVSGGGLVGFAAMFALERLIDHDLTALEKIAPDQAEAV